MNISFNDLRYFFITHRHSDHSPQRYYKDEGADLIHLESGSSTMPAWTEARQCPGHSTDLRSLVFWDLLEEKKVWIVGDAVFNKESLEAWRYYWPNDYTPSEIAQTRRSVAYIFSEADIVVPGHGDPIAVTPKLIEQLASSFSSPPYAKQAPGIEQTLQERLEKFK